jgi:hypothetical protein
MRQNGGQKVQWVIDIPLPLRFGDHWLKAPRAWSCGSGESTRKCRWRHRGCRALHRLGRVAEPYRVAEHAGLVNEKIAESDPDRSRWRMRMHQAAASAADAALHST